VIIEGVTDLTSGIATPNAYSIPPKYGDAYMIKLDENGQREWGTYYGGNNSEGNNGAADVNNKMSLDQLDNIYLVGNTNSTTGISTPGAHQENYMLNSLGGLYNTYLAKFQDCLSSPEISSNSPICIGNTIELKASGGTNYAWTGPNGFTSMEQNPTILNATTLNSGEYRCLVTGTGGCDDTKKVDIVVGDIESPIPNLTSLPILTGDCNTVITAIPTATDSCAGTITATTASAFSYSLPGTYTVVWNYNDGNGNISTQNQTVTIINQPLPTATSPQTFCIQQNANINDIIISGQNIKWYDNLTNGTLLSNTAPLQNGTTYYASQTINGCESERIPVLINIQNTPVPTGNANQTFCSSQNPTLDTIQISGTSTKWYNSSGTLLINSTSLQNGMTYYATQTVNNCESERLGITISIVNTPATPTAITTQSFCKKENARLSTIQITGQDIKWYETNFSTISLPNSTLLENNKSYYASQTIGCESDRIAVLIRIYDTPPPTGNTNQQFCFDENAQISNLNILGSNMKWYDALTNGTVLAEITVLTNGVTYYATQTLNDCESERIAITVTIQDTQSPIGNPNQTFCIQENAKISTISIEGQNIKWYTSLSSLTTLSESIVLENGMTYYASQTINNCESERNQITVKILEATNAGCLDLVYELPYPKFLTPNGDGFNDNWTINFAYLKPNTGIKIFDRYGKLLTVLNQNETWNGTYNNQQLPATDYWFVVTRADGNEYKGHFSLKR
ncbi:MAG: T9SS type B sorting domain-containing protein, partial [Methylotenera sp.]|nr:T9SS type B sorting domain-containing protein [Flavobacterium sp.]